MQVLFHLSRGLRDLGDFDAASVAGNTGWNTSTRWPSISPDIHGRKKSRYGAAGNVT